MTSVASKSVRAVRPAPLVPEAATTTTSGSTRSAASNGVIPRITPVGKHPGLATRCELAIASLAPGNSGRP